MNKFIALLSVMFSVLFCQASTVSNPGFETDVVGNGLSNVGIPADWFGNNTSITIVNPLSSAVLQPTQGNNFIQFGTGFNQLKQTLLTIEADTIYTFQVDVGINGQYNVNGDWYRCALIYEGQPGNEFIVDINQFTDWPANNSWITVTLEFSTFESPELVGRNLQIMLGGEKVCFDNVRYSYVPQWDGVFNGSLDYNYLADGQISDEFQPSGWFSTSGGQTDIKNPLSSEALQPVDGDNYGRIINGSFEYFPKGGIYPQTKYSVDLQVALPGDLYYGWYQVRFIYHNGSSWVTLAEVNQNNKPIYTRNTWNSVHLEFYSSFGNIIYPGNVGQLLRLQINGQGVAFDNCRITQTIVRPNPVSTFYISSSQGNDGNDGLSSEKPWRTFSNINKIRLIAGDKILLKRGDVWNEQMRLWGSGQSGNEIELSAYANGEKPRIIRNDEIYGKCVVLENPSHWHINNIDCRDAKLGVYLRYDQSRRNQNILIEDCDFYNMNQIDYWDPSYYDYELSFNAGVMVGGKIWHFNSYQPILDDLTIRNCRMLGVTHAVLANWYYPPRFRSRLRNLVIEDCVHTGGYGMAIFHTNGGHMSRCYFYDGETGFMPTGTCQGILQTSKNFTIDSCVFSGTSRQGGAADGCSFDFEGDNQSCTFSNNVSYDCDGQSLLILGTGGPNKDLTIKDSVFFNNCKDALLWQGHNYELIAWDSNQQGSLENLTFYSQNSYGLYSNTSYFANFTKTNVVQNPYSMIENLPYYWHFNTDGDLQSWHSANQLTGLNVSQGSLGAVSSGDDPYIISPETFVVAAANPLWTIRMKTTAGDTSQIYFITRTDQTWNDAKSLTFPVISDGNYHTYDLDMFGCDAYKGVITQVRLDPVVIAGADISIDYVKLGSPQTRVVKQSRYPASFTVSQGWYLSGAVDKLRQKEICFGSCFNPDDYISISSNLSSGYSAWADFDFDDLWPQSESVYVELHQKTATSDNAGVVFVELYNFSSGLWTEQKVFNQTTDYSTCSFDLAIAEGDYIDSQGKLYMRAGINGSTQNTIYFEYVKVRATRRLEIAGDMNLDKKVDINDYANLYRYWNMEPAMSVNGFYNGADINADGIVNIDDIVEFIQTWLY